MQQIIFLFFRSKKEYKEKPLSNFVNSILNFNSLIPSNKEIEEKDIRLKKKVKKNSSLIIVLVD